MKKKLFEYLLHNEKIYADINLVWSHLNILNPKKGNFTIIYIESFKYWKFNFKKIFFVDYCLMEKQKVWWGSETDVFIEIENSFQTKIYVTNKHKVCLAEVLLYINKIMDFLRIYQFDDNDIFIADSSFKLRRATFSLSGANRKTYFFSLYLFERIIYEIYSTWIVILLKKINIDGKGYALNSQRVSARQTKINWWGEFYNISWIHTSKNGRFHRYFSTVIVSLPGNITFNLF